MSFQPSPSQVLYLWSLLASGGEGFVNQQPYELNKASDRKALVNAGFISEEKRKSPTSGRLSNYNTLCDAGWAWMDAHLTATLPTRSTRGVQVMQQLIARMADFLAAKELSLAEFICPAEAQQTDQPDLIQRIRTACYQLGQGQWNTRVRLADLRQQLADVDRDTLDQTLLRLQQQRQLLLYPQDDPQQITAVDQAAAITIGGVGQRHLVYMQE